MKKGQGPLSGVTVIDLTAMVMGPYATQILADMGANVIKVEAPGGDANRYISVGPVSGMGGIYVNTNRGKRSIVLDLKTEKDKATLRGLIAKADIFIHSFRAKAMGALGFSYDDVAAIKPDIIYTNCYGYGRRGPDRDLTAYDDIIQAECGIPAVQEMLTGEAGFVGTIMADKVSGLHALYATLAALFHRAQTGEGQEVEVGMFESMASFMLVEHANGAMYTPPLGPAFYPRVVNPDRKPYETKDGHIAAMVYNDKQWNAFMAAVKPAWGGDPDHGSLEKRAARISEIYALLRATFKERTTQEWLDLLRGIDIPCAPLRTPQELFDNEHLNAVDFFEEVDTRFGTVRFPGVPTWFSKTPGKVAGPAPTVGENGAEILSEFGLDDVAATPD